MNNDKPILSAIAAMAKNRVIGKNNKLPWHLPADLKHFKEITTGHPILMGRKTYESIGRPLPDRTNLIMTRDPAFSAPDCILVHNVETAFSIANEMEMDEIFVIGGAEVYRHLLPQIQRIYLTEVMHKCEGDAYFPELDQAEWKEVSRDRHQADEKNAYDYSFVVLERV